MIDWLTFNIACEHSRDVDSGRFMSTTTDGEIEYCTSKFRRVSGSHDCSVRVRTARHLGERTHIQFDGNPAKFLQGHNLWGSDDLPALICAVMEKLVGIPDLHLTPTSADRTSWGAGGATLSRVDVTESFNVGSKAKCIAWLEAAGKTAVMPFRGRPVCTGSTIYFGKNSRRWSLKLYSKAQEILAAGHGQPAIENLPAALAWVDGVLRAELTLRGMELKRRNLAMAADWLAFDAVSSEVTAELLRPALGAMTMTTNATLPAEVFDSLSTAQRTAFCAWQAGHDLRALMSRRAFYRLRSVLLAHGIDVSSLRSSEVSNVVPLIRVIEAVPMAAPDWAVGTPLFFEPRRLRVA